MSQGEAKQGTPELPNEGTAAAWLVAGVLAALLVAKSLQHIPYLGPLLLSAAAFIQLYLPMWRCERRDLPYEAVGLDITKWRRDAAGVAALAAIVLPPYAVCMHIYITQGDTWATALGFPHRIPVGVWAPHLPQTLSTAWDAAVWFVPMAATHLLGVALPEETFYRGYLQAQWQQRWPPRWRLAGTPLGQAAVASATLFALGHFLGEWNPGRFGPFFPGLLFAWLRNRSQTVVGAVAFHGLCNIWSELLFHGYRLVG